ncbi:MAG: hypothetical protein ACRBN8_39210 [Nannocystales bacterium]
MTTIREYFIPIVRAQARKQAVFGVVFAILPSWALSLLPTRTSGDRWALAGVSVLFAALGLYIVVTAIGHARKNPAIEHLLQRPREIVWVYDEALTSYSGRPRSTVVYLCTRAGEKLRLPCRSGREAEALAVVVAYLPHAYAGFDHDVERRFLRDPASL